jgi:CRP-like cAMP-binding protein
MMSPQDVSNRVAGFFAAYSERIIAKGQIIVHAGEDPKGVYFIEEGRISQYDISDSGNQVVVNVFKPGAFFPMSWAINKTPNQYFFEATTRVVVRQAPAEEVVAFIQHEPEVLFDLLSRVYRGTDGVLRRLAHLMGGDARSRLLFEILNAANRFGRQNDDGSISMPLKESDLAKHSGLARETVSRIVQSLKFAGLLKVTRDGLVVTDPSKLKRELGSNL